ncbi:MAG: hypothetical protein ACOCU8_02825 [Patescibacteria group bacterium]
MFYIITGDDESKSLSKLQDLISALRVKHSQAVIRKMSAEDFEPTTFNELIGAEDLFTDKRLVIFKRILTNKNSEKFVWGHIKSLAASKHIFIFWEPELSSEVESKLRPLAVGFKKYDKKIKEKVENKKDIFRLSDTFSQKNKKALWLVYHSLRQSGYDPEELFWSLYRQVKSLLLVKNSHQLKSLKWHPFFLKKQQQSSANFTKEELAIIITKLSILYSQVIFEKKDWDESMEDFIFNF